VRPEVSRVSGRGRQSCGAGEGEGPPSLNTSCLDLTTTDTGTEAGLSRWLSCDQIRKMQRMRRETVVRAMDTGELPFERRGRVRYARLSDVLAWEQRRLEPEHEPRASRVRSDLADLA
jgi:hypothetical protein